MKRLFIVFLGVLCVLSACNRGPNPKDSLVAAGNAIVNYDTDNIDKYVDLTSIINDLIDVVSKQDIKEMPEFDVKQMVAMKAIFVPMIKQYILGMYKELENSEYSNYVKAIKVQSYKILSNKDGVATAEVKFDLSDLESLLPQSDSSKNLNKEIDMVFEMKQRGDHWQIVKIANLDEKMDKYKSVFEEQIQARKEEQALKEPRNTVETMCQAQKVHYIQNGVYATDFANLNMRFQDNAGNPVMANGRTFTNKGATYMIANNGKVSAVVKAPKPYSLEKDCANNMKIVCRDNGNGTCKQIGL